MRSAHDVVAGPAPVVVEVEVGFLPVYAVVACGEANEPHVARVARVVGPCPKPEAELAVVGLPQDGPVEDVVAFPGPVGVDERVGRMLGKGVERAFQA